jgi:hypothetical protein
LTPFEAPDCLLLLNSTQLAFRNKPSLAANCAQNPAFGDLLAETLEQLTTMVAWNQDLQELRSFESVKSSIFLTGHAHLKFLRRSAPAKCCERQFDSTLIREIVGHAPCEDGDLADGNRGGCRGNRTEGGEAWTVTGADAGRGKGGTLVSLEETT